MCLGIGLAGLPHLPVRGDEGEDGELPSGGLFAALCLVFLFTLPFTYITIKKKIINDKIIINKDLTLTLFFTVKCF